MTTLAGELREAGNYVSSEVQAFTDPEVGGALQRVQEAAAEVGRAWSGSPIGLHTNVYYEGLMPPAAGHHFSREWGFYRPIMGGSAGPWESYTLAEIEGVVFGKAGVLGLDGFRERSATAARLCREARAQVLSVLHVFLQRGDDAYVTDLLDRASRAVPRTEEESLSMTPELRTGVMMTRDPSADGVVRPAPHHVLIARASGLLAPFASCRRLQEIAYEAANHVERIESMTPAPQVAPGRARERVFIGHGRSREWLLLKDLVTDEFGLPYDAFERKSAAGLPTTVRLQEMVDEAMVALIVLTAEDETAGGSMLARQNVIHEVGLFQGALGFDKAFVLLEDGCEEFSNIAGLGQIRFPAGNVRAAFEDVRAALRRAGVI